MTKSQETGVVTIADTGDLSADIIYTDLSTHPKPIEAMQKLTSIIVVITPQFACSLPRHLKTLEVLTTRSPEHALLATKEVCNLFKNHHPALIKQKFFLIYPEIATDLSLIKVEEDQILILRAASEIMLRTYHSHWSLRNYYDEVQTTPLESKDVRLVDNWDIIQHNFTLLQQTIFEQQPLSQDSIAGIIEHISTNAELYFSYCEHSHPMTLSEILRPLVTIFLVNESNFIEEYTHIIGEDMATTISVIEETLV